MEKQKKVLFVINHFRFSNGVAAVLRSLIANMDESKYDISLLAIYEFDREFAEPILNKTTIVPGFNFYIRGFDKIVNMVSPKFLYSRFVKNEYDLEVAFQFGIPTKMIANSKNSHRLCWMHTFDANMELRPYYEKFPKVINVAKAGRDKMIAAGFDQSKCDYCYNIIDESAILKAAQEECPIKKQHKFCIVTVARLAPDKAFMRYLECIKEIVKTVKDTEYWIIGSGSEEKKMRQYVDDNNLKEWVKMLGKQSNPFKYVKDADLYFCCSYREGFSTSCQEAALLGIPVVSVEVDGASELHEITQSGTVIGNSEQAIVDFMINFDKESMLDGWKNNAQKSRTCFYKANRLKKIENLIDMYSYEG